MDGVAPCPEQEQEWSGRDCSPCAGCDQDPLVFLAVCLSSPARAGGTDISYPLPPIYSDYMEHLWAGQGLCHVWRY